MTALPSNLIIRWMSFAEEGERIVALRRAVFSEQGFGETVFTSPYDDQGLHLGAFENDELVSVVSAFYFQNAADVARVYGLPAPGPVVQFSRRAELRKYRGHHVAEVLAVTMVRMVYEYLRPRYTFICLQGKHIPLADHYCKAFGFEVHGTTQAPEGDTLVLFTRPGDKMRQSYLKVRKMSEPLWERLENLPQSLVKHLDMTGRMDLIPMAVICGENLYTSPLSLKDELPRLSAQTRVLFAEQKSRIEAVDFPKPPARLLDVGAGPGVYLSALGKNQKFKGYELIGLDASKDMVTYARLNRPDLKWFHTSAYDTKQADCSIDVVHLNFVFIHLLSPAIALREFARILKPGGMLYVVDINDSTAEGSPEMVGLIQAHHDVYEGNRNVLNELPRLAKEWGFTQTRNFSSVVRNIGTSPEPEFLQDEVRLDRIKMWGVFSFLGQREELVDYLKTAHEAYFNSPDHFSIAVQTQVYRKNE